MVEADVGQLQAQQILPVDPHADRVGGLSVGQPLHELQERREREPDRRLGGPPPGREQVGEVAIRDHPVQIVVETHDRIALWEDRPRDLRGLVWHHIRALRVERHHPPPADLGRVAAEMRHGPSSHRRSRAEFATNISLRGSCCKQNAPS